jgi:hypothetical protein
MTLVAFDVENHRAVREVIRWLQGDMVGSAGKEDRHQA